MQIPRPFTWIWGFVFMAALLWWGPSAMIEWNEARSWPVLRLPGQSVIGLILLAGGAGVALYCSRLFERVGKGTPVPFDPPKEIVVGGLYRFTRNPIYVADVAMLLGIFLYFGHLALLLYVAAIMAALQAVIVWWEEPVLRRRFGESYSRYTDTVPRWFGRRQPANR